MQTVSLGDMQIVFLGDNLHEMTEPTFGKKNLKSVVCWFGLECGKG